MAKDTWDYATTVQLEGQSTAYSFYTLRPVFVDRPPERYIGPIALSEVLREDRLAGKSKIQLAFTLSKAFWQFYRSDWMQSTWDLDTILLLPQKNGLRSLYFESQSPFLSVDTAGHELPVLGEYELRDPHEHNRLFHRYPYILNLGLLLVLLCTEEGSPGKALNHLNSKYLFCKSKLKRKEEWPVIDLAEHVKERYRDIVGSCLPRFQTDLCISIDERRQFLLDKVVRPLYELLQSMDDPVEQDLLQDQHASHARERDSRSADLVEGMPR
jgi:hypothetical protein